MGYKLYGAGAEGRKSVGIANAVLDVGECGVTLKESRVIYRHKDGCINLTSGGVWHGHCGPEVRRLEPGELIEVTA